jgi:hypothetical protein
MVDVQHGIHSKHVSVKTATKVDGSRARAVTAIHNGVGGKNTGMHVGISNALNFIAGKNFFTEQTAKVYKLQRGVVGKSTSHKIKGEIEWGLVIETTDENVLLTANGGSGRFEKHGSTFCRTPNREESLRSSWVFDRPCPATGWR